VLASGGAAVYLARKASAADAWLIDPGKCINVRLGTTGCRLQTVRQHAFFRSAVRGE
jgi:hypothetical protein